MVKIRPLMFGDATRLNVRPEQNSRVCLQTLARVSGAQDAVTFTDETGRPFICGGFSPVYDGRCVAWALVDRDVDPAAWRYVFRQARRHLIEKAKTTRRIEAYVLADWTQARKTLGVLGFIEEGVLKDFVPDGDCIIARHYG